MPLPLPSPPYPLPPHSLPPELRLTRMTRIHRLPCFSVLQPTSSSKTSATLLASPSPGFPRSDLLVGASIGDTALRVRSRLVRMLHFFTFGQLGRRLGMRGLRVLAR